MRKLLVLLTLVAAAVAMTMVATAGTAVAGGEGDKGEKGNACPPASKGHGRTPPPGCGKDGENGKDGKKENCNNKKDDDGDGKVDGDDPDCKDDGKKEICDNGKDDDGDGKVDGDDPDCPPPAPKPQCSDGLNNDDDEENLIDAADPSCHSDGDPENPESYSPDHDSEFDCNSGPAEPDGHAPSNYGALTGPLHSGLIHQFPEPIAVTGHDALCAVARLTGGAL